MSTASTGLRFSPSDELPTSANSATAVTASSRIATIDRLSIAPSEPAASSINSLLAMAMATARSAKAGGRTGMVLGISAISASGFGMHGGRSVASSSSSGCWLVIAGEVPKFLLLVCCEDHSGLHFGVTKAGARDGRGRPQGAALPHRLWGCTGVPQLAA